MNADALRRVARPGSVTSGMASAPPDTRTWPATVGAERDLLVQLLDYHRGRWRGSAPA
jgi:hypothetical protein